MIGVNHALTGALIGGLVSNPIIAIPLAFASHFVCDALPHFGQDPGKRNWKFKSVLAFDGVALAVGAVIALVTKNYFAALTAIVAISPDFIWIARFIFREKWGIIDPGPKNAFSQWHSDIQKYERDWGVYVEIVYFAVIVYLNVVYVL
ncbi:MAG: hypothetical protein ACK5MU_03435 [Candidatus Saccharimonadales bacterium]